MSHVQNRTTKSKFTNLIDRKYDTRKLYEIHVKCVHPGEGLRLAEASPSGAWKMKNPVMYVLVMSGCCVCVCVCVCTHRLEPIWTCLMRNRELHWWQPVKATTWTQWSTCWELEHLSATRWVSMHSLSLIISFNLSWQPVHLSNSAFPYITQSTAATVQSISTTIFKIIASIIWWSSEKQIVSFSDWVLFKM